MRICFKTNSHNVLTPFCTALGVQTPLYCVRILYSNEGAFCTELHRNTCVFCMDGQKLILLQCFIILMNRTPFNSIYNTEAPKTHELKLGYRQRQRQLLGVLPAEHQGVLAPARRGNLLPPLRKILLKKSLFCVKIS